jgi:hypothetical protein
MSDTYSLCPLFGVSILKICSSINVLESLFEEDNFQCSYKEYNLAGIKLQAVSIALIW